MSKHKQCPVCLKTWIHQGDEFNGEDFTREFISWWRSNRKLVSEMFQKTIPSQLVGFK